MSFKPQFLQSFSSAFYQPMNLVRSKRTLLFFLLLISIFGIETLKGPSWVQAQGTVFVVNSTADIDDDTLNDGICKTEDPLPDGSDQCTLRAAIRQANATPALDVIWFNIPTTAAGYDPSTGSFNIYPSLGALPKISSPIEIDGYSQPGAVENGAGYGTDATLKIVLNGAFLPQTGGLGTIGLDITARDSIIRGLVINSFSRAGIYLRGSYFSFGDPPGVEITGNFIGTDVTGYAPMPNNTGIDIAAASDNTRIGGIDPGDRNLISGNSYNGVAIGNGEATGNVILGNLIGTDRTGESALPNELVGVLISTSSGFLGDPANNTIGGSAPGAGNVISGNGRAGIEIFSGNNNTIIGNYIGSNAAKNIEIPNGIGIHLLNKAENNTIGGISPDDGNYIANNTNDGILISDNATNNKIIGNHITLNHKNGIHLYAATNTTIGGDSSSDESNKIEENLQSGILLEEARFNEISSNRILNNASDGLTLTSNSENNQIHGSQSEALVIGGNQLSGIRLEGSNGNTIQGAFIGNDGFNVNPNAIGILIIEGSAGNIVGGDTPQERNIISGNSSNGLEISGPETAENKIQGNYIGPDLSGLSPLQHPGNGDPLYGNLLNGILITDGANVNTIGGSASESNLISGNSGNGILIEGAETSHNIIQSNIIGGDLNKNCTDDAAGDCSMGNGGYGILLKDNTHHNLIGSLVSNNSNTIAYNGYSHDLAGHGIEMESGVSNTIRRNSIYDNHGRGINLLTPVGQPNVEYPFTINDYQDKDGGPNNLQNYPVVSNVQFNGSQKTIEWKLVSTPQTQFVIDIYANDELDPSGFGEGQTLLHTEVLNTNEFGKGFFSFTTSTSNTFIAATATSPDGSTSEFSIVDTDGDGLADAWETAGMGLNVDEDSDENGSPNIDLDLAAMGANPLHKDLFVEIDAMIGLAPSQEVLDMVSYGRFVPGSSTVRREDEGFAYVSAALVNNPDGQPGINLHLETDPADLQLPLSEWTQPFEDNWPPEYTPLKAQYFGNPADRDPANPNGYQILSAKHLVFRYGLFANNIGPGKKSGLGELGGNDFIVSLGRWGNEVQLPGGTDLDKAGSLMHELGHTLGLKHGGQDHVNCKTNYHSVMNYTWQSPYYGYSSSWTLNYSSDLFPILDENAFNTQLGIGGHSGHQIPIGPQHNGNSDSNLNVVVAESGSLDASLVTPTDPAIPYIGPRDVSFIMEKCLKDTNGDGKLDYQDSELTVLTPYVDWDKLVYYFHTSKEFADGVHAADEVVEEISLEDVEALNAIGSGPGQIQFSRAMATATELDGYMTVSVVRAGGIDGVVTVDYSTTNSGTATAGVDFTAVSGTLTFPDLTHVQTFTVPVNLDSLTENYETIEISLSNPGGGAALGSDNTLSVKLYDDREPGIISFADTYNFSVENVGQAAVELVRTGGQYGAVSVTFSTMELSAIPGSDYTAVTQTVTFGHGQVNKTVFVPIIDDVEYEYTEFIDLALTNPTNGSQLGERFMGQLHILDNESSLSTFVVTTTADSGIGSLRKAITLANLHIGPDVILFDIPGSGVHTITPLTRLPVIDDPVIIDGYSQPGASPNTLADGDNAVLLIELDGSNLYQAREFGGLELFTNDSVIRGLVINRVPGDGIYIDGNNNLIEGNFIGTDPSGTESRANWDSGIIIFSGSGNQIGGSQPASRNILSGNELYGIGDSSYSSDTIIQGNYIGVQADGVSPLGNEKSGLLMLGGAVVGGPLPGQGNIIAYNQVSGIDGHGAKLPILFGNSIYNNTGPAYDTILNDLKPGIRTNVPYEADDRVNFPILPSATYQDGNLVINGRLDYSRPNTEYLIQFYANDTIEPNGFGEGQLFLGSLTTTTDSDGDAEFTLRMAGSLPPGQFITATATDFERGTSEFSARLAVGDVPTEVAVVNTVDDWDDGVCDAAHCSLREAIFNANNHGGESYITFDIGSGHQTIQPLTPLPHLSGPTTVDGNSQPGFAGMPIVELSGDLLVGPSANDYGLWLAGGNSTVRGMVINQFSIGIKVGNGFFYYEGIGGNVVQGNLIGTDVTGTAASGNWIGVSVSNTPDNLIGGTNPTDHNIISGNNTGINIWSLYIVTPTNTLQTLQGTGNIVQGNYIGLDVTGSQPVGNNIGIAADGAQTIIGGSDPEASNIISGNNIGIDLFANPGGNGSIIQGNIIGTDSTGTQAIGNSSYGIDITAYHHIHVGTLPSVEVSNNLIAANGDSGIHIFGHSDNRVSIKNNRIGTNISGTVAFPNNIGIEVDGNNNVFEGNLISGNQDHGILFHNNHYDPNTFDNVVSANLIGVQADGISPLGNGGDGVLIDDDSYNLVLEENTIAYNAGNGISVSDASTGNTLLNNNIYSNGGLGIDLGLNGVSVNDTGDGDSGANELQNYPVLIAAESGPAVTLLTLALNSTAATTYTIEVYSSDTADLSGYGEGKQLLTQFELVTDANGARVAQILLPGDLPLGTFIAATATDAGGQTSEFSAAVPVTSLPQPQPDAEYTSASDLNVVEILDNAPPVVVFGGPYTGTEGQDLILDGGSSFAIGSTITSYEWDLDNDGLYDDASGATAVFNQPDNGLATIALQVTDANGQTAEAALNLSVLNDVPNVNAGPDLPVDLATNFALTASFTDTGLLDTHTATINWGEGITETAVVDQGSQTVSGSHVYNVEGTYPIEVCVTDSDGDTGCDDALLTVAQVSRADLVITQSDSADPVGVGQVVTHSVVIDNLGPTLAEDVDVLVEMSVGVIVQDFSTSQGSCLDFDEEFICFLGDMAAGSQVVLEFAVVRNSTGYIVVYSEVDSRTNDPDFSNNDDSEFTQVIDNQAPAAVDDSFNGVEDTPLVVDVLTNDSDGDGDPLSVTAVIQPANGTAVINADNTITYSPDADYNLNDSAGGPDTFSYTVSDGTSSASASVAVTVSPVNDAPVAADDTTATSEDAAVIVDLLANDSDVDGDSLTIASLASPTFGSVVDNGDGTISYTPDADRFGTEVFSYTVSDGSSTAQALVTIEVVAANDAPTAVDDTAVVDEDGSVTIYVLDNDSDVDGDTIQLVAVIAPANGSVLLNGDGTLTYTPDADYNGADSLSYTIDDGSGALDTAVVTITVNPVNDAPNAADDLSGTLEDTAVTIAVLDNDGDIDGDSLTISILTGPTNGSALVNPDGTISYTPTASYNGSDSLVYSLSDGLETDTAVVTITITAENDNPVAADDPATTSEDTVVTIPVLDNDGDIDGDPLTVSAVTTPANGSVVINPDGSLTYSPAVNFNGTDSLVYTVIDGQGGAATAQVTITVSPVNDAPMASDDSGSVNEDASIILFVLDNDSDVDGDSLTVTAVTMPANGAVVINADNSLSYSPDTNFNGSDSFGYTVEDGQGGTATAQVTIIVDPVNDAPAATDDLVTLAEDTAVTIPVLDNDSDVDGDSLTIASVTVPVNGTAVANPDGTITYTPETDFNGADSFDYTVDDGNGGSDTATVVVIINPVSDDCQLFPIALHEGLLANAQPGDILNDILNGEQAGNFGWLTWSGNTNTPTLINSLTLPGDSDSYINPNDASDNILSVGDWVEVKPGVSNAAGVRNALDMLSYVEIQVPVWDVAQGNGANTVYHITGFANIRILGYDLPGQDQITAEFVGFASCGG